MRRFPPHVFAVAVSIIVLSGSVLAQLDPGFGTGGIVTTNIYSTDRPIGMFLLPDQKIFVVSEGFQTEFRFSFLRYNIDGTPDVTYGTGGRVELPSFFIGPMAFHQINGVFRQPDGKIILVGTDNFNGFVARFNENGTLDTGFAGGGIHRPNISQGPSQRDVVYSAVVLSDGKILIGGTTETPQLRTFLLRYLPNGDLDGSFGNEGFIIHTVAVAPRKMFLQPSGKIVATDVSARSVGIGSGSIRRFNSDGSLDNTFLSITFPSTTRAAAMQQDGKIVIGESIAMTDTLERANTDIRIARYSADGVIDSDFGIRGSRTFDVTSSHCDDSPNGLIVASDGQIIISAISTIQPNRGPLRGDMISLSRLTASGSVNGKFLETSAILFDDAVLSLYPDGRILTAFTQVNTNTDLILARATGVPLQNYKFRGVPFDFPKPATDGLADIVTFRPSDTRWYFHPTGIGNVFGLATDILVASDYIRDPGTERAVFRPSNGTWHISRTYNEAANFLTIQWGANGDIPAPADFDGDAKSDLTVFRPSDGVWYIRNSSDGSQRSTQWGTNGDKPSPGDFDGDTIDDIAVFRPSDGNWYILKSSDGQSIILHFGLEGDVPVQEDYDGDGKTDIAVWRPSTGVWYRLNSSDGSFAAFNWGISTDLAVPADYDGDRKTDIAVYRPSIGRWYVFRSSTSSMDIYSWGIASDKPVQAKY